MILAIVLALAGSQAPVAWNRFRGPNGTGIAAGGKYPAEIGPEKNVRWVRSFPEGHSSPVLSASRIFLTGIEPAGADAKPEDGKLFTYALERASGETVWKREAPRPRRTQFHPKNHPAAASAAVDGDTVVVFFDEFGLLAYDHDGAERWKVELGPFDNVYGMGASPILVGDTVVLACDQSTSSYVMGLSKKDGRELWRTPRPQAVSGHCTPVVYRNPAGVDEVILPGSLLLDAYDVRNGERLWWVQGLPGEMKSVPVLVGERLWIHGYSSPLNEQGQQILVPPFDEAMKTLDKDGDGRCSQAELPDARLGDYFPYFDLVADGSLDYAEWEALRANLASVNSALLVKLGGRGDRTETNVVWRTYRGIPQLPSPLVYEGTYYMLADQGGLLTLLDPETGEQRARERLTNAVDAYYAAPVAGDGKVYLLSEGGILSVLAAGSKLQILHTADFDEPSYATPALEDGRIYLRTSRHVYCFGEG